jgi:hypothetical protein
MSASKIQYQNKERDKQSGKPAEKTWRYQDANEVKEVVNQHADQIDALGGADMQKSVYDPQNIEGDAFDRSNHIGTQTASTISDFDTSVSSNTDVAANTAKNSYPSTDSSKLSGIEAGAEVNTINSKTTGEPTGSDIVLNVVSLTQAEYDASTPVSTTFYLITDA